MKRLFAVIILIVIALCLWLDDTYHDRQYRIVVHADTPLFAKESDAALYGSSNHQPPIPIRQLRSGEHIKVRRTTYGKDFWALYLETEDGVKGWVISGQEGIELASPGIKGAQ